MQSKYPKLMVIETWKQNKQTLKFILMLILLFIL